MAGTLLTMSYPNQLIGREVEFGSPLTKALLSVAIQRGRARKNP